MEKLFKNTLVTLLSIGAVFSINLSAVENKDFEQLKVIKDINGTVTGNTLIAKNVDLYLIKGKNNQQRPFEIVIDKNGNYLILSSKVFDVQTGQAITIPLDVKALKNEEAFTYGNGKKHLYIFTDPECPYCKRFVSTWESLKNDVTLHIFFYNLNSHTNANAMTRWILDAKDNEEKIARLFKVSKGDTSYKTAKYSPAQELQYNKILNKQKMLGESIGIQGVPAVIDTQGKQIPWPQIKQYLK